MQVDKQFRGIAIELNSDGSGADSIIINDGGYRNPVSQKSFLSVERGNGILSNNLELILDGMNVFSFGINCAPKSVKSLLERIGLEISSLDCVTFHQANMFMNEMIRKKLKLPAEKVPYSLKDFGNTSSASIPLTLVTERAKELREGCMKHVACGFGVGLSWGSVYFETDKICVPALVEI